MIKGLFNSLLKNLKQNQNVMLNWFQHLVKSMSYETLKSGTMNLIQGMVQGDRLGLFTKPSMLKNSFKGFTLIEIIVVIVILSIVSAISIKFLADSLRIYTMTVNQKTLLDEGKLSLERMCRDIRDGRNITTPGAGGSGSTITFLRTNLTVQDIVDESITFRLNLTDNTILEKVKSSPVATSAMAFNVTTTPPAFSVTRGQAATNNENEITIQLSLALGSGENVNLQTRVYPKNLLQDTVPGPTPTYKNFFYCWEELRS